MCGVKDVLLDPPKLSYGQGKRESTDVRKEKSRDAARNRRAKESDYFQELEELIPVHGTPPHSQMTSIDKTSLIRLTVSYLKTRDLISNGAGANVPEIKEENELGNLDVLTALNGFGLVLNHEQDIVYVTNNVSEYIGLTSFELLGMHLSEFVHPCDHTVIRNMFTMNQDKEQQDTHVKASIRIKCTITDRGRLINLKQANYKALKLEGKLRTMPKREEGGLQGPLFIGVASLVSNNMNLGVKGASGTFETKHSQDFKIIESDPWLLEEGGYPVDVVQGESFFKFIHAEDAAKVSTVLAKLPEHGHCETEVYRLLVGGGGYVCLQTTAAYITPRRGSSKGTTILLRHSILTETIDAGEIVDIVQMKGKRPSRTETAKVVATSLPTFDIKSIGSSPEYDQDSDDSMSEVLEMLDKDAEDLKMKKEMDLIVDLVSPLQDDNYVDLLSELPTTDPGLDSTCNLQDTGFAPNRSSVIVSRKPNSTAQEMSAVTEKLFCDEADLPNLTAVTDKLLVDEESVPMTAVTEKLFVDEAPQPMTAVTESLFKNHVVMPDFTSVTESLFADDKSSGDVLQQESLGSNKFTAVTEQLFTDETAPSDRFAAPAPIQENKTPMAIGYDDDVYPLRNVFGNLMVEDLEKLSPFIGDECISLAKGGEDEAFSPLSLETFDDLDFGSENFKTEQLFAQDDEVSDDCDLSGGLVGPQADIMWGGGDKDSNSCVSSCSLISPRPESVSPASPPYRDLSPRDLSSLQQTAPGGGGMPAVQEPELPGQDTQRTPPTFMRQLPVQQQPQPQPIDAAEAVLNAPTLAPASILDSGGPGSSMFADFIAKEMAMAPRKPVPIPKSVLMSVPAPPPRDNRVVNLQELQGKLFYPNSILSPEQQNTSDQSNGSSGVIVERQRQQQPGPAAMAVTPPRYVIVPARYTFQATGESVCTATPSSTGRKTVHGHKKLFAQSVPVTGPVEPPPAACSGVIMAHHNHQAANGQTRNSVLRNMLIDDSVQKSCTRGEKRVLPVDCIQQPSSKQMRLGDVLSAVRRQQPTASGRQNVILLQNNGVGDTLSVPTTLQGSVFAVQR